MDSILEDVQYIDDSLTNFSTSETSMSMAKELIRMPSSTRNNLKNLDAKSKAIEKIIIKSFFKSIFPLRGPLNTRAGLRKSSEVTEGHFSLNLSPFEEEQLAMKLVQILINNYPEIMRIPDDLITNVNYKFTSSKSSGSLHRIQSSSNINKGSSYLFYLFIL